ncbi:MAG: hypothetical protein ACFFCZ_29825 [Promethearchaeota archaeon]
MRIIETLLESNEPLVRLKSYRKLLNYNYEDKEVRDLTKNLKKTSTVAKQLFAYAPDDVSTNKLHVYKKWQGVHWILAILADLEYPPGDHSLIPSRDLELEWLFSKDRWGRKKTIEGRKRFCASQEGNGLFSILKLGLDDDGAASNPLVERLTKYQWADGGWNCDIKPSAMNSSYHESLIPMRALNLYSQMKHDPKVKIAVNRAAEVFLKRELYMKEGTSKIIENNWIKLHYPPYWHYNILTALKVMAESGKINNSHCNSALDLLESKRLADGGFPAEMKYYTLNIKSNYSPVDWGGINKHKMNEWVTIDALYALKEAARIDIDY